MHIRWLIQRDMIRVLEIEKECFGDDAWTSREITEFLRRRNVVGMVAEQDSDIVGFMLYTLERGYLVIENIAVAYKREGIGTLLVNRLKQKLEADGRRRSRIVAVVNERNVEVQLFLRSCGFVCNRISRDAFVHQNGAKEDGYAFDYLLNTAVEVTNGAD